MLALFAVVPLLPFVGFLVNGLFGRRLSRPMVTTVGVGSVGVATLLALIVSIWFMTTPLASRPYTEVVWPWIEVRWFRPQISFYLDSLAVVMMLVVTGVGFLIHLYSAEFMEEEEGYSRYFAYLNLFVGSMLLLVLGDNLLLLFFGWEGVGLCSYLLIGFWYRDPANGRAAQKAFIVTRVGDAAFALGLFLIFVHLGTFDIQALMRAAEDQWAVGSGLAVTAAILLLIGAIAKSAQLVLHTWLPDAMAGPTPVSALIHAATMVTAGVYLIARLYRLFLLAPDVLLAVAVIGAATLLVAGVSGIVQRDIKRVLAYSTISQIGYMFLGLGVGAWSAAIFHLMAHAFFKALLFLGAGVIIHALHHEHDLLKMGGLRKELPLTFWTFLIAGAANAGVPIVTVGFYSKDLILSEAFTSERGSVLLWAAGLLGVLFTSIYIFRLIFLAFFGELRTKPAKRPGPRMQIPLAALGFLCLVGGVVNLPPTMGNLPWFEEFVGQAVPSAAHGHAGAGLEVALEAASAVVVFLGIYLAYRWFFPRPLVSEEGAWLPAVPRRLQRLWFEDWGFDWLYDTLVVRPYAWAARINRNDFVDWFYRSVAWLTRTGYYGLKPMQNGRLRWYAGGIAVGAVVILAIVVLL